jgi:hypothetical protein
MELMQHPDAPFIRMMIIKTIADVTGDDVPDVARRKRVKLDTRDWEQVVSRLEAVFDCTLDLLLAPTHVLDVAALTEEIGRRTAGQAG